MYTVRSLTIRQFSKNRDNDLGFVIMHSVDYVSDLVAVENQYHLKCIKKIYQLENSIQRQKIHLPLTKSQSYAFILPRRKLRTQPIFYTRIADHFKAAEYRPSLKTVKTRCLKVKYLNCLNSYIKIPKMLFCMVVETTNLIYSASPSENASNFFKLKFINLFFVFKKSYFWNLSKLVKKTNWHVNLIMH